MAPLKLWFSLFDLSFNYKGKEPSFYPSTSFLWAADFEKHYDLILEELTQFLVAEAPKPYFKGEMVNKTNAYRTISLRWWDLEFRKNQGAFPVTSSLLLKYPEITTLSFNFLSPNSAIAPHCGDTNAIYRCHFGLTIPNESLGSGLSVKGERVGWVQGKWLIFMDAFLHESVNDADEERIIMLMDVLRPEFVSKREWINSVVLTSLFLQKRAVRFANIYRCPQWLVSGVAFCLLPFSYLSRKLANLLRWY